MKPRTVFVDGYNVIRNTPALKDIERRIGMDAGRDALLRRLVARYRHTPHQLVVVFDGDGSAESSQPIAGYGRGRVIFSQRGEKADTVILRLASVARGAGQDTVVFTNDVEVRLGAEAHGAMTARTDDLREAMEEAPRLLRKRFTHQQAVRREMEKDAEDAEARAMARKKGNPHRAPRKRGR
jgi:predicted RNA-binding protein with PIN domain